MWLTLMWCNKFWKLNYLYVQNFTKLIMDALNLLLNNIFLPPCIFWDWAKNVYCWFFLASKHCFGHFYLVTQVFNWKYFFDNSIFANNPQIIRILESGHFRNYTQIFEVQNTFLTLKAQFLEGWGSMFRVNF